MSIAQPIHLNGVTRGAVNISPCSSRSDGKRVSRIKILSLNSASRSMSCVCNASSGSYRRNPDFPKQNKQGFRSRNKHFEERDGSDHLEDSEIFSSKNGSSHSVSGSPRYQATAAPGPREKEIVELFRKVQAQLRERAAIKEEKKSEEPPVQVKKNETVDSLLKLLRKHSVQQGKKSNNSSGSGRDFVLDQPELNGSFSTEKSPSFFKLNNKEKTKYQETEAPSVGRPMSSFRRRSPVPQMKKQPTYVDEDSVSSITHTDQEGKQKDASTFEHEVEHKPILKLKVDPLVHDDSIVESDSAFPEGDMFNEMSDGETTETDEGNSDEDADEQNMSTEIDLSGMKLVELRALAKSRGMKGFSKLKKQDLIQLLAEDSV
ncbi:rho-N domain-containing protein 1, chloroplastic [Heracleum sosnowskyi]|uniref:Rho-N domain-containing protein 1, chloroplastic n=1 Tax=Heracleum sosnowskyi TaxID=360622 RepID=A0AAD8GUX2_9APIA|nr:rho-N domain-containing protein 1, chloroplastic [Heracleum sosnowskyi]